MSCPGSSGRGPDRVHLLDTSDLLAAYAMPDEPALRVNFIESADGAATVGGKSGALGGPAIAMLVTLTLAWAA